MALSDNILDKSSYLFRNLLYQKRKFVEKYGKDAEKVMRGRATNVAKKQTDKVNQQKLKSLIKEILKKYINEQKSTSSKNKRNN